VVKTRVSGSSAARIYFDHFIFKFPNLEVNFSLSLFVFIVL